MPGTSVPYTTPYHYNNNSTYNIVQVVHGLYFTKGRKIYARNRRFTHKYNSTIISLVKNKKYYSTYYSNGNYVSQEKNSHDRFRQVQELRQIRVEDHEFSKQFRIYNYHALPYYGPPIPAPNPDSPNYIRENREYNKYKYKLRTISQPVENYKVYKCIYPNPVNNNNKNLQCIRQPVNVQTHNSVTFRNWIFKQVKLWAQFEDLHTDDGNNNNNKNTIKESTYPEYNEDFYKVKYMIPRK